MPDTVNRLRDVHVGLVSFVDRASQRSAQDPTQPQRFLLWKAEGASEKGSDDMPATIDKAELDPDVRAALEKAEQEAADAQAALEKATTERDEAQAELEKAAKGASDDDADDKPAEVNKAELAPEVRAALEKAEADAAANREALEKAEKDAKEASELAKAERDIRVTAEWVTKSETGEYAGLPGAASEVGPVLKSLQEAAPEAFEALSKTVLAPAAAQLRESELLKEQGSGGEGPPPESAIAKLEEKADEIRKADSSISRTDAKERARREHPDLARQAAREMGIGRAPAR